MPTGRANITLASNIMTHIGFQLELIRIDSKDQLGHSNGVSPNIFGLLVQLARVHLRCEII